MDSDFSDFLDEGPDPDMVRKKYYWDEASINKALEDYYSELSSKDILLEKLWFLIKAEIIRHLAIYLKDDVSLDDAELFAIKELKRRLEKGSIKYLSKKYVGFIAKTAIQNVKDRQKKYINVDFEKDANLFYPRQSSQQEQRRFIKYADLYFCLKKLTPEEIRIVYLHHFEGLKLEDVAIEMGISYETVRKRHSRIVVELRKCLEGQRDNK